MSDLMMNYWANFAKYGKMYVPILIIFILFLNLTITYAQRYSTYENSTALSNYIELKLDKFTTRSNKNNYEKFLKDFKHCKLYNEFMYKNVNYEKNETRSNVCEDYKKFLKRVSDEKNESGKY
jgi:hypothetical protein